MSHATLTVALPGTLSRDELDSALTAALARYDENREVARYVEYTRAELIANSRKEVLAYEAGTYAKFIADPAAYAADCDNVRHLEYLAGGTLAARALLPEKMAELENYLTDIASQANLPVPAYKMTEPEDAFPARLQWTDEDHYRHQVRWYEAEEIGPEGEVYSERNPDSKWDWYSIGGRWANYWKLLPAQTTESVPEMSRPAWERGLMTLGPADLKYVEEMNARPGPRADVARKCDIDFADPDLFPATFAFLDSEGEWHEKGLMGWFGMSTGDKEEQAWHSEYAALLAKESDNCWLVLVDYHI